MINLQKKLKELNINFVLAKMQDKTNGIFIKVDDFISELKTYIKRNNIRFEYRANYEYVLFKEN